LLPFGGSAFSHAGLGNVFFDPILLKPIEMFILSSCSNLSLSTCLVVLDDVVGIVDTGEDEDDDEEEEEEMEDEDIEDDVSIELIFDVFVFIVVVMFIDSDLREKRLNVGDDTLPPLMILMIDLIIHK